jgi:hypothetical protein
LSKRSRRMLVHDPDLAMGVTAVTDMVALLPRSYARTCANSGQVKIIELPKGRLKPIEVIMTWHGRCHDDPGSIWLRQSIRDAHKLAMEGAHRRTRGSDFHGLRNTQQRTTPSTGQQRSARVRG